MITIILVLHGSKFAKISVVPSHELVIYFMKENPSCIWMHFQFKKYFPLLLGFQSHMYLIKISVRMKWMMTGEMMLYQLLVSSCGIRVVRGRLMWQRRGNFNQIWNCLLFSLIKRDWIRPVDYVWQSPQMHKWNRAVWTFARSLQSQRRPKLGTPPSRQEFIGYWGKLARSILQGLTVHAWESHLANRRRASEVRKSESPNKS